MSGFLATVDPGKRLCGVALWYTDAFGRSELVATTVVRQRQGDPARLAAGVLSWVLERTHTTPRIVSETPQDYEGKDARAEDLESVRATVEALRLLAGPGYFATRKPAEWKGNVPKPIHGERIRALLTPSERARVNWNSHDLVDAVGLGLFEVSRAGRGGVRPGPVP